MSEWRIDTLGHACNISTGFAFKGDKYEPSGNLRVVRGENVTVGELRWDSEKHWNHSIKGLEDYFLEENDIVIGMDGSRVGHNRAKIPASELPLILAQRVARLRVKNGFDQNFIWYQIFDEHFKEYVEAIHTGTSIPHISMTQIGDYEIAVPSLPEQKAIAAVLSSLDDKIDLLHRQNKTLESMAGTLFRQWFIEEAKEDWKEVTIGDFVELNRASIDKSYSYKTIYYLDTGSLTNGIIEGFQSLDLDEAPSRAKRLVQHNDVLISTVRPDQKHYGIIKNPIENLVVSTGFCVLTCTKIDPHFIYLLLTNGEMTDYLHSIAEGSTSTYPSLKPSDIGAIVFSLPPTDRLKEFSIIADNSWKKIERNHIQIRTLVKLRDALLPKLMSGEVRVAH